MLGCPRVRLIHQECTVCGQADALEIYAQVVPPGGNYGYDLMVEIGLARFRDHQQDAEIQARLRERWGLMLPASSIGLVAHSFLDGVAAVHQANALLLRAWLAREGGYALHVDGTCEADTDVLFTALAEPLGWVLDAAKMTSENKQEIAQLLRRCVARFDPPLAVVRDLSANIAEAIQETIPGARDLICHYHFLENVGSQLCEKPHAKLTAALRRLKVGAALRSIRKDLVRWSRKGARLSPSQIEDLLSHAAAIVDMDFLAVRRFVAYLLLRWLEDYKADLRGEYFPFDLPQLAFYRRGRRLADTLANVVALPAFPQHQLSTLTTIAGHLRSLHDDPEVVAAAARLEKAAALFEELRKVLRLTSRPDQRWLRGTEPNERQNVAEQLPHQLDDWRDCLRHRRDHEPDEEKRSDQSTVLKYLEKYQKQLVGHVIELAGNRPPLVVRRTNNPAEHRFGATKRGIRRKVGVKKLTRQIQAMRPEVFLVGNFAQREYLNLVLDGSLENLPGAMARHWQLAQAIRRERLRPTTEHPMPTTKKRLRDPQLLETVTHTITKLIDHIAQDKIHAA
jgi:hypothetical protein